ncbi:MAG: peptide-methionine (S)-S-oxide reductase MsrA [Woeseiaceae bacterium]|nr:peptide-methionine (S)-S-oxide reductase MsrA [Woeseiaceae bacterium]
MISNSQAKNPNCHFVNGNPIQEPFAAELQKAIFGLGCFWGAEKCFWEADGVFSTAVGFAGGNSPNPNYKQICTGATGHAEVVMVIYEPIVISYIKLLKIFWENHDPTQGNRQGNDIGTQYRSIIQTSGGEQYLIAKESLAIYQNELKKVGLGQITTEISPLDVFHYAEDYHQQYLAKNPNGYCGLRSTGISFDI